MAAAAWLRASEAGPGEGDGVTDAIDPTIVNDHDFASASNGKVIPHGIYDVARNQASVHLNSSKDTSQLACDSMEL